MIMVNRLSLFVLAILSLMSPGALAQECTYFTTASPAVLDAMDKADALMKKKDYPGAKKTLEIALKKAESVKPPKPADMANVCRKICEYYENTNRLAVALPYAKSMLNFDRQRLSSDNIWIAEDSKVLGDCYASQKKYDDAILHYQDALVIGTPASEVEYVPCVVFAAANLQRKQELLTNCYEGVLKGYSQSSSPKGRTFFDKEIRNVLKAKSEPTKPDAPDAEMQKIPCAGKERRAELLFRYYRNYLKADHQVQKLRKFETEVEAYRSLQKSLAR